MKTLPLRRLSTMSYGDALAAELREEGSVPVMSSGGQTGRHNEANTRGPVIVVGRKGSHGSLWWSEKPAFVIDTAYSIDASNTGADLRWLYYCLQTLDLGALSNDVGVPGLSRESAYDVRLPVTPLGEQRRIADFLDDRVARIDRIIAARRDQLARISELRASMADDVISGGAWNRTTTFRRVLKRIEQGWSPQCDAVPAAPDEWGVLKVSAVNAGRFRPEENKRLPDELQPQGEYEVRPGDVLVTRANTPVRVGAFAVVPPDVRSRLIVCDKIMRLTFDEEVVPGFAALVGNTRRVKDRLSAVGTGTSQTMVNIRGEDIRELPLPMCSLADQHMALERYGDLEESVAIGERSVHAAIDLLTEYKTSLITAAVTGELDVTTSGSGIPG